MEKKKVKLFSAIALMALALLVVGVTYAYFQNQYGSASNADVNVTTYTTDVLTFATGDDINLEADQTTFGKDKGSVSGATYASALLTANNKTNKAVEHYYLYLNIENNTFTYSVQDNKPELIMTITDKDGNEVKNIEGLTYTEVTDRTNKKISGYDITTKSGLVTIFNNREIIAEPKAEDKWNITITFVNYEADQNANTGKVLSAKLMIQKNEYKTLVDYVKSLYTGVQGENNLYHHDGTLENGINDGSYRYAGGEAHPDFYTCKYNDNDVSSSFGQINTSLKGNCDSVSIIYSGDNLYIDKSITKVFTDKTTIKWDNANNKCVTTNGEEVQLNADEEYYQSLCNGYAYKGATSGGESPWLGGIKIEELGSGEETLFTPEDKENQKPALYSCKYNDIDVVNGENKINASLKGDCSIVYKVIFIKKLMYVDNSIKYIISKKESVKWDATNNKCVTVSGEEVYFSDTSEPSPLLCTGDAYYVDYIWPLWMGGFKLEEVGPGEETLYAKARENINNFICFGSNKSECPDDNLYRIIGVVDGKVKLIKSSSYKSMEWDTGGNNTWSTSSLNAYLNNEFINTFDIKTKGKIAETTWKVGGNTFTNIASKTPSVAYQNVILNPIENITYDAKIGLMYVNDYGFAAEHYMWKNQLSEYNAAKVNNWMYMGANEWTITRDDDTWSFYISIDVDEQTGVLSSLYTTESFEVRPTFSLLSSVSYKSGTGTIKDPIRIN